MVAKAVVTVLVAYWLILSRRMGVEGAVIAQLAGSLGVALVMLATQLRLLLRPQFHPSELWDMLKFGLGLIPGNLSAWVLSLSNRYVIQYFLGPAAVGLYSLAYKVSTLIEMGIHNPFGLAWSPVIFPAAREGRVVELIKRIFTYYNALTCLVALALGLFAKELLILLGGQEYSGHELVVFLVALGLVAAGWPQFVAVGFNIVNKTYYFSLIYGAAAAFNVGLNLLLVPHWGITAAAGTTLATYVTASVVYLVMSRRYIRIEIEIGRNALVLVAMLALYFASGAGRAPIQFRVLSLIGYFFVLWVCGLVTPTKLRIWSHNLFRTLR
jgi:O-antigen/teichoic acid export membrane protein